MERPNIVWITLDSVRADHTSIYGYERETTPNISAIANDSDAVAFSNCISHATGTPPSVASILTGTYPSRHGIELDDQVGKLTEKLDTIPELLRSSGYRTSCITSNNWIGPETELNRGFDSFSQITARNLLDSVGLTGILKYLLNIRTHSGGLSSESLRHSTSFLMNTIAKRELRDLSSSSSPFFLYLHYNDPHRPYYPPVSYRDVFGEHLDVDPEMAAETSFQLHKDYYGKMASGCDLTSTEETSLRTMYDSHLRYTDSCIGVLYEYIQTRVDGDVILVVTSDHGDHFGEYDLLGHLYGVHDQLANVPMVVKGLTDVPGASDRLVQHADIMKTVLSMTETDTSQIQGYDLREDDREFTITQDYWSQVQRDELANNNPTVDMDRFEPRLMSGIRTKDFKYVKHTTPENPTEDLREGELFKLPDEGTSVKSSYPERSEKLDQELSAWLTSNGQPIDQTSVAVFDEEIEEQLSDLGYL